jgi:hypothetical protein
VGTLKEGHRRRILAAVTLAALATLSGLAGAATAVVQQDGFCTATCHEMEPLTAGLQHSAHRGVPCLGCHGKTGTWHVIGQKLAAVRSLVAHIGGGLSTTTHADVPDERCRRCHKSASLSPQVTIGTVAFEHADHTGAPGVQCVTCHRTAAHGRVTAFAQGAPAAALSRPGTESACLACHTGEQALECAGCHVRAGHLPRGACARCHRRGDWRRDLAFRHQPILGEGHAKLACETCHRRGVQRPSRRCSACHAPAHGGLKDCGRCHVPARWKPSRFTHRAIGPHGPGGRVAVACATCHPAGYATSSCSCHLRPAGHPRLSGSHGLLSCSACHWSAVGGSSTPGCASCHGVRHTGLSECSACHTTGTWATATPRHDTHVSVACDNCHEGAYGRLPAGCSRCHRSPHGGPADCVSCHGTGAWKPSRFVHPNVVPHVPASTQAPTCADCHPTGYARSSCSCHAQPSPSPPPSPSPSPPTSPSPSPPTSPTDTPGPSPAGRRVSAPSPPGPSSTAAAPGAPAASVPGGSGDGRFVY